MNTRLYIEGGGDSKETQGRCREGFRKLLEKSGFSGKLPQLIAGGGRKTTFDDFKTRLKQSSPGEYVAMLIDSEDPTVDGEKPWQHLRQRPADKWDRPAGATDDQVLLMTTCMETWIVADRAALKAHYAQLQVNALPPLHDLENRHRHGVQDALVHATRDCSNKYSKGKRSFEVLALLDPESLKALPSFTRMVRILKQKL